MDTMTVKFKVRDQVFVEDASIFKLKDSALEALFSGRHSREEKDGLLFIDRDPEVFKKLIKFLKSDKLTPPRDEALKNELSFWGIPFTLSELH